MKQKADREEWSAFAPAITGASCGAMLAMFHEIHPVLSGVAHEADPFLQIMVEVFVVSLAGMLLFVAAAVLRHRLVRPKSKPAIGPSADSA